MNRNGLEMDGGRMGMHAQTASQDRSNQLLLARGGLPLCGRGGAVQHAEPVGGAPGAFPSA